MRAEARAGRERSAEALPSKRRGENGHQRQYLRQVEPCELPVDGDKGSAREQAFVPIGAREQLQRLCKVRLRHVHVRCTELSDFDARDGQREHHAERTKRALDLVDFSSSAASHGLSAPSSAI